MQRQGGTPGYGVGQGGASFQPGGGARRYDAGARGVASAASLQGSQRPAVQDPAALLDDILQQSQNVNASIAGGHDAAGHTAGHQLLRRTPGQLASVYGAKVRRLLLLVLVLALVVVLLLVMVLLTTLLTPSIYAAALRLAASAPTPTRTSALWARRG